MKKIKFLVLLAALTTSAMAFGYPMNGHDLYLNLAPGITSIQLIDGTGQPLDLINGIYRFRFSNKSKSFHIMKGGDHDQEFKVPGGFPNGNLRDFVLPGAAYGNHVDLTLKQHWEFRGSHTTRERNSCTFQCGTESQCHNETSQVCKTDPKTGQKECHDITRVVCRDVPRYCSGEREYEVTYNTQDQIETLRMDDSDSKAVLGELSGTIDTSNVEVDRRIIFNSCY